MSLTSSVLCRHSRRHLQRDSLDTQKTFSKLLFVSFSCLPDSPPVLACCKQAASASLRALARFVWTHYTGTFSEQHISWELL
jgi:hypothetical protein